MIITKIRYSARTDAEKGELVEYIGVKPPVPCVDYFFFDGTQRKIRGGLAAFLWKLEIRIAASAFAAESGIREISRWKKMRQVMR